MTTIITGHRVFTCNICGATFRFTEVATHHPEGLWTPVTYGTVVDEAEDSAIHQHATYSTHVEELTADTHGASSNT